MQLQLFTEQLNSSETRRRRFSNSANYTITQLLNLAVSSLAQDEYYCQIGCDPSAYLIGALLNNTSKMAYLIDDLDDKNIEKLEKEISNYDLEEQILFCQQNSQEFFWDLRQFEPETKIGVYFYNSSSDYRSVFLALLLVKPFLSEEALIIVNNSNYSAVQQAIADFLLTNTQSENLLQFSVDKDNATTSGQQIRILKWNTNNVTDYDWSEFIKQNNHEYFIKYLTDFNHNFEQIVKDNFVKKLSTEAKKLVTIRNFKEAITKYQDLLRWESHNHNTLFELGLIYFQLGNYQNSLNYFLLALEIKPDWDLCYYNIAIVQELNNEIGKAIKAYQKTIELEPYFEQAYNKLGKLYLKIGQLEESVKILQQCLKIIPHKKEAYLNLILSLQRGNQTKEILELCEKCFDLFPEEIIFQYYYKLAIPLFYESIEDIKFWRNRFIKGLQQLEKDIDLVIANERTRVKALEAIQQNSNFFLAYQNYNDLELQKRYGKLVTKISHASYPQWSFNISSSRNKSGDKIKIGFVSGASKNRAKWLLKWLTNIDRNKFIIYAYIIEDISKDLAFQFKQESDFFYCIYSSFEQACEQIVNDKLDILTYTEIGMLPQTIVMGSLKLAPIQCVTLGHPLTSGLPAIDYYISRELMEPDDAQKHYSEKLFRLPNIGIYLEPPNICNEQKSRQELNLKEGDTIYLCSQLLFKYLPQHDYLFPEIAAKVNNAKFVFIEFYKSPTQIFKHRLKKVFGQYGLNIDDYCLFLPRLKKNYYLQLNFMADIFLDTLSWSGDNTTREAIACNLPIVTCPGEFMRNRHSYGILKMIGIEETIATNEQEYIKIAVNLGLDKNWRQSIIDKIKANQHRLYDDLACVKELEDFYQKVIANYPEKLIGSNL